MENLQDRIIKQLNTANHSIKIAVAWITDRKLIQEITRKAQEGIKVEVIMSGCEMNLLRYEDFKKLENTKNATVYISGSASTKFSQAGKPFMHHKFIIIDDQKTAHGSRNWSINAQYHDEYWEPLSQESVKLSELLTLFKRLERKPYTQAHSEEQWKKVSDKIHHILTHQLPEELLENHLENGKTIETIDISSLIAEKKKQDEEKKRQELIQQTREKVQVIPNHKNTINAIVEQSPKDNISTIIPKPRFTNKFSCNTEAEHNIFKQVLEAQGITSNSEIETSLKRFPTYSLVNGIAHVYFDSGITITVTSVDGALFTPLRMVEFATKILGVTPIFNTDYFAKNQNERGSEKWNKQIEENRRFTEALNEGKLLHEGGEFSLIEPDGSIKAEIIKGGYVNTSVTVHAEIADLQGNTTKVTLPNSIAKNLGLNEAKDEIFIVGKISFSRNTALAANGRNEAWKENSTEAYAKISSKEDNYESNLKFLRSKLRMSKSVAPILIDALIKGINLNDLKL